MITKDLTARITLVAMVLAAAAGCGVKKVNLGPHKKSDSSSTAAVISADAATSSCVQEKTPAQFVTSLTQDLFRRGPTQAELAMANQSSFKAEAMVDWAFTQPDYDTGLAYFVSNLLRLEQNLVPDPNEKGADIGLLADLKPEAVLLVQRNKDKPWSYIFTTQDIYCSAQTAPLYGYPVDKNISGFVGCKMPPERAGILGLVSVLRAFSSAYYTTNSNRHRVAIALYLGQGLQLAAKTDGPTGSGRPLPLAECVPEIDTRISSTGQAFGTAAVPKVGPVCAGCHSKYLAPMEPAFLRFGLKGELLNIVDIDNFPNNMINGIDRDVLKDIMQYGNKSCWDPDDEGAPPQVYTGQPGLARLIGNSPSLGRALAVQIQQNLVNKAIDDTVTKAIMASYEANGKTLQSALRGFFLSPPYQCAVKGSGS